MYVNCESGCLPLMLEGLVPPPGSELLDSEPIGTRGTFREGGGSKPCEGVDAVASNGSDLQPIGVPLKAVLRNLWIGGPVLEEVSDG